MQSHHMASQDNPPLEINSLGVVKMLGDILQRVSTAVPPASEPIEEPKPEEKLPIITSDIPKVNKTAEAHSNPPVHFGEENWSLILNMMMGIKRGIENAAETFDPISELTELEFKECSKLRLASSKVGRITKKICKFRDFAPKVFERLRTMFGITSEKYIKSLGVDAIVHRLMNGDYGSINGTCSTGKSGSFFYHSDDGNYLLKTIQRDEYLFFKSHIKSYYDHMTSNPDSLVCRFFGFHKLIFLKDMSQNQIYYVVMENVFNSGLEIHTIYDLKGSTYGRTTDAEEDRTVARKDIDFIASGIKIHLGLQRKAKLMEQIAKDCEFFVSISSIDYSLLLGIHNLTRSRQPELHPNCQSVRFTETDNGGLKSPDGRHLYIMGIIDVFTSYNTNKKIEHALKSSFFGDESMSCVPPEQYAERFLNFVDASII